MVRAGIGISWTSGRCYRGQHDARRPRCYESHRDNPNHLPDRFRPSGSRPCQKSAEARWDITGFALLIPEVSARGLTLLQEAVPSLRKVAVIWNGANAANAIVWKEVEATARLAGLTLNSGQVREPKDFEATFAAIMRERPQGLLTLADSLFMLRRKQIVDFVLHEHLPAMFQFREFAQLGGLMSYGPNVQDIFCRGANYVDKILKGTRPADLPIEQPTKFELVINLKTAKALGLTIPQ